MAAKEKNGIQNAISNEHIVQAKPILTYLPHMCLLCPSITSILMSFKNVSVLRYINFLCSLVKFTNLM